MQENLVWKKFKSRAEPIINIFFLLVLGYFILSEAFKVAGNIVLADWTGIVHVVAICLLIIT